MPIDKESSLTWYIYDLRGCGFCFLLSYFSPTRVDSETRVKLDIIFVNLGRVAYWIKTLQLE